jgi:tRNA(His) 5'-end guanylyltransferase
MSYSALQAKRNRRQQAKATQTMTENSFYKEDFIVRVPLEDGAGMMKGRFLPNVPSRLHPDDYEATPWCVRRYHHYMNVNGTKFFVHCPTSVNDLMANKDEHKNCPICEWNRSIVDSEKVGVEWVKANGTYRRKSYYANFLVLECKNKPSLERKVIVLSFGQQLYDILEKYALGCPEEEIEQNYFWDYLDDSENNDPCEGRVFKIQASVSSGQTNYFSSQFIGEPWPLTKKFSVEEIKEFEQSLIALEDKVVLDFPYRSYEDLERYLNSFRRKAGWEGIGQLNANEDRNTLHTQREEEKEEEHFSNSKPQENEQPTAPKRSQASPKPSDDDLFDDIPF